MFPFEAQIAVFGICFRVIAHYGTYTTMDLFLHFRHITITYLEGIEQTISQSIKTPQCFNSFEVQTNSPKAYAKKRWKNK